MNTNLSIAAYRSAVVKTLPTKLAKAGMRRVAQNSARANIMIAAVTLASEMGELVTVMTPYLLEGRLPPGGLDNAKDELGDIGYSLVALAKVLKVKVPGNGKKLKLVGTRGKAVLDLSAICERILAVEKRVFYNIAQKTEKVGEKNRTTVDVALQTAKEEVNNVEQRELLAKAIDLYYRLVFDMTGEPPAAVMGRNFAKLKALHGEAMFAPKPKVAEAPKKTVIGKKKVETQAAA